MRGCITVRHVLLNPVVVIQGFGWLVFFRAITGQCPTFLECACASIRGTP